MSGAVLENVPEERKDVVVTGENLFFFYSTRDLFLQVQDSVYLPRGKNSDGGRLIKPCNKRFVKYKQDQNIQGQ